MEETGSNWMEGRGRTSHNRASDAMLKLLSLCTMLAMCVFSRARVFCAGMGGASTFEAMKDSSSTGVPWHWSVIENVVPEERGRGREMPTDLEVGLDSDTKIRLHRITSRDSP